MRIESVGKNKVFIYALFILILFFIYNVNYNPLYIILGLATLVISLFLFKFNDLFLLSCILAPNLMMIKFIDSSLAIFGYFLVLIVIKGMLVGNKIKGIGVLIALTAHVFLVSVTSLLNNDPSLFGQLIRQSAIVILALLLVYQMNLTNFIDFGKKAILYYVYGCVINVILGILYYRLTNQNIKSGYFSGINNDRNYFSSMLTSGISILLLYILYNKKARAKLILMAVIMFSAGILSNSRNFILSCMFCLFILLTLLVKNINNKSFIYKSLLIFIAIIIFLGPLIADSFTSVINRFTNDDIATGNGRFVAWRFYIGLTCSSPLRILFGNGSSNKLVSLGFIDIVEHNTFIQALSTTGIFGCVSLGVLLYAIFKLFVPEKGKLKLIDYIPLLCVTWAYMGINGLYSDNLNYAILLCFIELNYCLKINTKKEDMYG